MSRQSDLYLSEKRSRKATKRRLRELKQSAVNASRAGSRKAQQRLLAAGWRLSDHLNRLSDCANVRYSSGLVKISIPPTFSIIEDPEVALRTIGNLARAASRTNVDRIFFDHSGVVRFDLAAEAVLMRVALEIRTERRNVKIPIQFEGLYPKDTAAFRFASAIGISAYLDAGKRVRVDGDESIRVFKQRQRIPIREDAEDSQSEKARTIEDFADHIDGCLASIARELTPEGRTALCSYTGEVIDNVEEHARSRAWFISSYLDTAVTPPTCEVSIYNFGRSFADSFSDLPASSYARQLVSPFIEAHKTRGFFVPTWEESDLLTLVALQGGISSKQASHTDTRGHGTIDLIEFFEEVFLACARGTPVGARMALLSGSTYILFDGSYRLTRDSDGRRIIAFNRENSLADAPDPAYVRRLKDVYFPGTVVSIRFPLQQTAPAPALASEV